jgi:hypothetical protein
MGEQEWDIMTRFDQEAHSFVIRLWRENREDNKVEAEWRGWIEHVQSGQRCYFRNITEINQIVATYLNELGLKRHF